MIDRVKYPFSYWTNLLALEGKLENPCQIDPILDVPTAIKRLFSPRAITKKVSNEKIYLASFVDVRNSDCSSPYVIDRKDIGFAPCSKGVQKLTTVVDYDNNAKVITFKLPRREGRSGNNEQEFNLAIDTTLQVLEMQAEQLRSYQASIEKYWIEEVQNECADFRRTTVVYTPVLKSDYVLQFTDPLLNARGATIDSIILPIKEQIAPAFLDYENSLRRLTALNQQYAILQSDVDIYKNRVSVMENLIKRDASDAWNELIREYGSTCTPLLAKLNGVYEQGTMSRTGAGQKWGGDARLQNKGKWFCELGRGLPPYMATSEEKIANAGGQETIRAEQRAAVYQRLDLFKSEIGRIEGVLKRIKDTDIPDQEKKVEAATKKWDETQKVVVDFLSKVADAQKTAAEANNYAAILEANRQQALAAEETKRQLQAIEAKEREEKRRSQTLMILAGAAVGISLLSRGQQGGSATNTIISVGALGLLGFGAYTYMKTSEKQVVVNSNESNVPSPAAIASRNYIRQKLSNPVSLVTVQPNRTTDKIADTMIDPRTGRGVQRTASNFYGFLPH